MNADPPGLAERSGLIHRIIVYWAIGGGLILIIVALINVLSILGGMFNAPFPGDFELTEMGVALAVFAFLPYCQLTGVNVTADIFTSGASPQRVALFKTLGDAVALIFSLLLLFRMSIGMQDQFQYGYTTAILQVPLGAAYLPILASLALLTVASLITLVDHVRAWRGVEGLD